MKPFNTNLDLYDDSEVSKLFQSPKITLPENINFGIGMMVFPTPAQVSEACKQALDRGMTFYAPTMGHSDLRAAIASKSSEEYGVPFDGTDVMVTPAGTNGLFMSLMSLAGPGDEVLFPDPGFPAYLPQIVLCGATPVAYPVREENDFVPDPKEIKGLITRKTKVLILNSPSNPQGVMTPGVVLENIAEIAAENDLFVLSDEAYKHIVYAPYQHESIVSLDGMKQRTVVACTLSKSFSMTGWRIGYIIAPRSLMPSLFKVFQYTMTGVNSFIQMGAKVAITQGRQFFQPIIDEMTPRRRIMIEGLRKAPGISFCEPQGAFYVFVNIKRSKLTSSQMGAKLLDEHKLITFPGSAFGKGGEGYLRLSYAIETEKIEEGLKRFHACMSVLVP
jgi:aspartate/methionine/tyrosine aminotransferase